MTGSALPLLFSNSHIPVNYTASVSVNASTTVFVSAKSSSAVTPAKTSTRAQYYVRIVDSTGTPYAEPINIAIDEAAWELNSWGHLIFRIPTEDVTTKECIPIQREAQLWYDPGDTTQPRCIWWGPIVSRVAEDDETTFQCLGLLWYLSRLQFGPILTNWLLNPDFESGTTNWTASGTTMSSATDIVRKGSKSLKLVQANQGTDTYAFQDFTYDNSASSIATVVEVAARCYIVATTATPFVGPAGPTTNGIQYERGLYVGMTGSGISAQSVWTIINLSAPRNQWFRIFAPPITVPAGKVATIEVRLYSPGGTVYWDDCIAHVEESTGANTASGFADLTAIIDNVLTYAQDTTKNKPQLHLTGPSGTFGTSLDRQYQFYDNGNIWDACFKPLIDANIMDVDVTWDIHRPSTRTVNIYTAGHKGSSKPQCALILGGNVAGISYTEDGQKTAGAVTAIGQGMANEQTIGKELKGALDFGYAVDTSANNHVTLDAIVQGQPEDTLDMLQNRATTELARVKENQKTVQFHCKEGLAGSLIGVLNEGDTTLFQCNKGWVQENSNRRVVGMVLQPEVDVLSVTGNLVI